MQIHLRDHEDKAEDWTQSPHIEKAIKDKRWTKCQWIAPESNITDDMADVNCIACQEKVKEQELRALRGFKDRVDKIFKDPWGMSHTNMLQQINIALDKITGK